ncbi:protein Z, vitamin K-dependent plasma glycoprotein b [Hypomesus transpacificus]|uniref:protein Z, vitamin K-dependent plasma glycoprotein b n=1 Tax=Hypomesus transpacificus TaxID=137520 RepID=UPI001F07B678|nr:protein Z, vitamin K-dependent plasma glycoprotein b [Hypomesus transpacificus]
MRSVMGLWQWYFLCFSLLGSFLLVQSKNGVFRTPSHANTVFLRPKRANNFFIEEMLQGNLERECLEERCNYEEAREFFEDTPKTEAFWNVYVDGDQCKPNPCLNDGRCIDKIGGYTCNCTDLFLGLNCETDMSQCPTQGASACQHFCTVKWGTYHCSCVTGYRLHSDKRSCVPEDTHPCGTVSLKKAEWNKQPEASNRTCPDGHCPWQVSLRTRTGEEQCGGVILEPHSVLTSAQCLKMGKKLYVVAGDNATGIRVSIQKIYIHSRYKDGLPGDDLGLLRLSLPIPFGPTHSKVCLPTKDFSENILMSDGKVGVTGVPDKDPLAPPRLTYLSLDDCSSKLNLSHSLSNKMFCMKSLENQNGHHGFRSLKSHDGQDRLNRTGQEVKDATPKACKLLPGAPVATLEGATVFLTGMLLSPMSHDCEQGVVFTKLSRYLPWIEQHLKLSEAEMTTQVSVYPQP